MYDYGGAIPLVRCRTGQKTTNATGNINDCDSVKPGKICAYITKVFLNQVIKYIMVMACVRLIAYTKFTMEDVNSQ